MVSIVWKQSYEISCLMASLLLLFYCILDKKSDFNILTDIFGLVAQAKSTCGGDEVGHSACFRRHKLRLSRPWFSFGGSKLSFGSLSAAPPFKLPLGATGLLLWYQNYAPSGRKIKSKSAGKSYFLCANGRTRII